MDRTQLGVALAALLSRRGRGADQRRRRTDRDLDKEATWTIPMISAPTAGR
jgi:hypothetical protein